MPTTVLKYAKTVWKKREDKDLSGAQTTARKLERQESTYGQETRLPQGVFC